MPKNETLFAGLYSSVNLGPLPNDIKHAVTGETEKQGSCDLYRLERLPGLDYLNGRLLIDWGNSFRAWIQRADGMPKPIVELRREFHEPACPGYTKSVCQLSELQSLASSWLSELSKTRGIYLLTCPRTKEQYVGSASGVDGFLGRWRAYGSFGHGGNLGLKSRNPSDYQICILETVGSASTQAEVLALEMMWKHKLQSQEMGLSRN